MFPLQDLNLIVYHNLLFIQMGKLSKLSLIQNSFMKIQVAMIFEKD